MMKNISTHLSDMKKIKIKSKEFARIVFNKMLEGTDTDYDKLLAVDCNVNGVEWYDYYTWSQDEEDRYFEWLENFIYTSCTPKYSKMYIKEAISMFHLYSRRVV